MYYSKFISRFLLFTFLGLFLSNILLFAQTSAQRYVLLEHFTNTYCPSCANTNPNFYSNILNNHQDTEVLHIAYHISTPIASDIFYQANSAEINTRDDYYSVSGTPGLWMQGAFVDYGAPLLTQTQLNTQLGQNSPLQISVSETTMSSNSRMATIQVKTLGAPPSGNLKLRAVVVERSVNYTAPNLETIHKNIFRQTLNGWNTNFTPAGTGSSTSLNYTYTISPNWSANQTYVIVFIQNETTKEVLNVGSSWGHLDVPIAEAKVKILLEGAYNTATNLHNSALFNSGLLPLAQPFNRAPWNYGGSESVNILPAGVVDWVLLELRNGINGQTLVGRRAAFLLADGSIRDVASGSTNTVIFNGIEGGNYYIAIKTRTHLPIMSSIAVGLPNNITLDLSLQANVLGGSSQLVNLGSEKYALAAGDGNNDGIISQADFNAYISEISINQYRDADCNFNGNVTISDFNLYKNNIGRIAMPQVR